MFKNTTQSEKKSRDEELAELRGEVQRLRNTNIQLGNDKRILEGQVAQLSREVNRLKQWNDRFLKEHEKRRATKFPA